MLRYFYKQGNVQNKQPLLYFHGIGLGVIFNTKLITEIQEDREIFIVELPWVSQRLGERTPKPQEFVFNIEFLLTSHGLDKSGVCVLGHSYGSCVATWMMIYSPKLVKSVVLIEPVCMLLFMHKVCYRFLYAENTSFLSVVARYFTAREISVAAALTRHF